MSISVIIIIYPDDDDRTRTRTRTPNAADSPRRLYQVHSPRKHQDLFCEVCFILPVVGTLECGAESSVTFRIISVFQNFEKAAFIALQQQLSPEQRCFVKPSALSDRNEVFC
jgi:hypothetical protein